MTLENSVLVRTEQHGKVLRILLDVPPANCYSYEMMTQLDAVILEARFNENIEVIVLNGAGDKFFCAGADIGMLKEAQPPYKYQFCLHANETLLRLEHTSKIVIAAINGHCVGGGLEVAMACDLRYAMSGKYKLGLPEMKLGVLPGTGGTARLSRLLGKADAMEMMLHSAMLTPQEAYEKGLVQRVIDAENVTEFQERVMSLAQSLTSPGKPHWLPA